MKDGLVFGCILVMALFNVTIGTPILVFYILFKTKSLFLSDDNKLIVVLLLAKILWIFLIEILFRGTLTFSFLQTVNMDIILILTALIGYDKNFFGGFYIPVTIFFIIDFIFNLWTHIFGVDPLGRGAGLRPDDIFLRVGGIFHHPFYSINISIVMILFSIYMQRKILLSLAIINVLWNGSDRGDITLIVLLILFILFKYRVSFKILLLTSILLVSSVFIVTIISVTYMHAGSGNFYRVFAWSNALENIVIHPILGTHTFLTDKLPDVSKDTIILYGVSESAYLDIAVHYGIFPALMNMLVLFIIFSKKVNIFYSDKYSTSRFNLVAALFAGMSFIDSFYGTFLGSLLPTMAYGLFCISDQNIDKYKIKCKGINQNLTSRVIE